jgi:hypothetical protein
MCASVLHKNLMKSHPAAANHTHLNCAPAGGRRRGELALGARLQEPRVEAAARSRAANAASSSGRAMPERQAAARPVIDRAAGFPLRINAAATACSGRGTAEASTRRL